MMMLRKVAFFASLPLGLLLFFLYSCTTKDGVLDVLQQETGSLRVEATEAGATIFLNNVRQDPVTPAVLEDVPIGLQVIRVNKPGFVTVQDSIQVNVEVDKEVSVFFEMQAIVSGGNVRVVSNPDSAVVLVNGIALGDSILTPTTLSNLDSGSYRIEIQKSGYLPVVVNDFLVQQGSSQLLDTALTVQRQVIVEHFSSSTCLPCVEADSIMEKILDERGVRELISIGYHTEIPSPGDPMHLEARTGNDARVSFYNISGNPISYFDGIVPVGGVTNLENRLNNAIDQRLQVAPRAAVEFFDYDANASTVSGRVRIEALQDISSYRLYIAAIETEVNYGSPPGINGMTHFFDVFRGFTPDENGIGVSLATGEHQFQSFSFPTQPYWDINRIQVVAFLQRTGTPEAAQAAWTLYPQY